MGAFETRTGKLWQGGKVTLPTVANDYAAFSNRVASIGADLSFEADAASDSLAAVGSEFTALKTTLQQVMAQSSTNLNRVGMALVKFAEESENTDEATAAELAAAKRNSDYEVYSYTPTYP